MTLTNKYYKAGFPEEIVEAYQFIGDVESQVYAHIFYGNVVDFADTQYLVIPELSTGSSIIAMMFDYIYRYPGGSWQVLSEKQFMIRFHPVVEES